MSKPLFLFTKLTNSYRVYVQNLESLTVAQIQEIELFVKQRKGIFDFSSYTFSIQKRVAFYEFVSLVKHLGIDAICKENSIPQEKKHRISFGQYKGMCYFELPDTYLLWLSNNYRGPEKEFVIQEIQKRKLS